VIMENTEREAARGGHSRRNCRVSHTVHGTR
jgi:hypothetical protein